MPDRYGRITGDDLYKIAGTIDQISSGHRQQAEWAKNEQLNKDANYNAGLYEEGAVTLDETSHHSSVKDARNDAMRGTPEAKLRGKQIAAQNMQLGNAIEKAKTDKRVMSVAEQLVPHIYNNTLDQFDKSGIDGTTYIKALGVGSDIASKTKAGRAKINKIREDEIKNKAAKFMEHKKHIMTAHNQGNVEDVRMFIEQMSKDSAAKNYFQWDDEKGAFKQLYRHSGNDEWVETGFVNYEDAIKFISNQTPEQYKNFEYATMETNLQWNQNAWLPASEEGGRTQEYTKDGESVFITPQVKPTDANEIHYIVTDKDKNQTQFGSLKDLTKAGYQFRDPKRETALKGLDLKNQQIATSKAAMNSHNRANQDGSGKKQLDLYSKQMKSYLAPFSSSGDSINFDDSGNLVGGQNAFSASQKFLHDHQSDDQSLTGQDQLKLEAARKADALYRHMLNGFKQQEKPIPDTMQVNHTPATPSYTMEEAMKMGAKQGSDGVWLAPTNIPGKARIIQVTKNPTENTQNAQTQETALGGQQSTPPTPEQPTDPGGGAGGQQPQQIRPELPQDISTWNVQVLSQNGQQIPVVITDKGPIPLTSEELELYKQYSAQTKQNSVQSALGAGANWFKENMTGTQHF